MFSLNPFAGTALRVPFNSIVPDFLLAFTFFAAASDAVLGQQLGRERPAARIGLQSRSSRVPLWAAVANRCPAWVN